MTDKCNKCGASIIWDSLSSQATCEYCGNKVLKQQNFPFTYANQFISKLNDYSHSVFARLINITKQFKKPNLNKTQIKRALFIIIPIGTLTFFLFPRIKSLGWIEYYSNEEKGEFGSVKVGKWSSNKRYRDFTTRLVVEDSEEPITLKQKADCRDWRYRYHGESNWKDVIPYSNGESTFEIVCNQKMGKRWIHAYTTDEGEKVYVKKGFWRKQKRFRTYLIAYASEMDSTIRADADCLDWRLRFPTSNKQKHKNWTLVSATSKGNKSTLIVCDAVKTDQKEKWFLRNTDDDGEKYFIKKGKRIGRFNRVIAKKLQANGKSKWQISFIADCDYNRIRYPGEDKWKYAKEGTILEYDLKYICDKKS